METIKIGIPIYDSGSRICRISIDNSTGGNATVIIDFKFLQSFASLVSKEVFDFLLISASVYGIDRFVQRKRNSIDGWSRELSISFPVSDTSKWFSCKEEIDTLLSFLTGDYWNVEFREGSFNLPKKDLNSNFRKSFEQINLLSGGLDSLIGALDFLKSNDSLNVLFVSHYDSQMKGPKGDQKELIQKMEELYRGRFEYIPSVRVSLGSTNLPRETTLRSRSFLFTGLALLAAQATETSKIVIPENGTVSLNFPLSTSRRSSCSTRTTHPFVLDQLLCIWNKLSIRTNISNPYEFKTKKEMVTSCSDSASLVELITFSNSCGKRGHRAHWENPSASHCGICMPCVYRQVSLLSIGDETTYGNRITSLVPFLSRKSQDVGACLDYLKYSFSTDEIKRELIINGVKDLSKLNLFADVVGRTRNELSDWVKMHGNSTIQAKAGV